MKWVMKMTNPKDAIAGAKVPMGLCPDTLVIAANMAFLEGALKYGSFNFKTMGAKASVYHDALERHMKAWWNGQDIDPASNLHHLFKMAACIAILIDCLVAGNLVDDRPPSVDVAGFMESMEPLIADVKAKYGHINPRHYTIADTVVKEGRE